MAKRRPAGVELGGADQEKNANELQPADQERYLIYSLRKARHSPSKVVRDCQEGILPLLAGNYAATLDCRDVVLVKGKSSLFAEFAEP